MEEGLFPDPAVAGILKPNFVEARLHTDRRDELHELQVAMTGSIALPTYLVIDPATGKELGRKPGAWRSVETVVAWIEQFTRS